MGRIVLIGRKPGIDPEILAVVRELNRVDYRTSSSCAGHGKKYDGGNGKGRGHITVNRTPSGYQTGFNKKGGINSLHRPDINKIISILKMYGLHNVKFERPGDFSFTAIGKVES